MAVLPSIRRNRSDLVRLHSDMDDLIKAFFGDWAVPSYETSLWPPIDIADEENAICVRAEVPGCRAENIDISVHGSTLTIRGEKKYSEEKKEKGFYHVESTYGSFRRDIALPSEVEPSKIEAACKDGILTVTLPKTEKVKPIKVKVKEQ